MKISNILTGIIAVFLLLFIILTFLVYHFLFKANILRKTDTTSNDYGIEILRTVNEDSKVYAQWFLEQNPEEIEMTSFDGLKLHAYFLPAPNGAENADATLLLMHGFHGSGLKDFAIVSKFYHQNNYNVLIPDQRTHGKSEGKYITFGQKIHERALANAGLAGYHYVYVAHLLIGLPHQLAEVHIVGNTGNCAARFHFMRFGFMIQQSVVYVWQR